MPFMNETIVRVKSIIPVKTAIFLTQSQGCLVKNDPATKKKYAEIAALVGGINPIFSSGNSITTAWSKAKEPYLWSFSFLFYKAEWLNYYSKI